MKKPVRPTKKNPQRPERPGQNHFGHAPRKRFGQHFLSAAQVIEDIVQEINPQAGERVCEIGPGLGALTFPLLAKAGQLCAIEFDRDLATRLATRVETSAKNQGSHSLHVIQDDALRVDFSQLAQNPLAWPGSPANAPLRVVGNLPYNISTPLLFHLLDHSAAIADQHFMLQKEVVERMVARPCTAAYGRLSVVLQWAYAMEKLLDVPPEAFWPPPRVESAVVRMRPHPRLAAARANGEFAAFGQVLSSVAKTAFSQRRKLLRHTLGLWLEEQAQQAKALNTPHFDLQRRAEEVPVEEYLALAQALLSVKGPLVQHST